MPPAIAILFLVAAADPAAPFLAAAELATQSAYDADQLVAGARHALDEHAWERAAELAAFASLRAPDRAEAALALGLARFRGGAADKAVAPFRRAAELDPRSATARYDLGAALYETGQAALAEAAFVEAAALDAKVAPLALINAGLAAEDQDRLERAARHYDDAGAAADKAGQAPLVRRAGELGAAARRRIGVSAEIRALAHAGKEALAAHRYAEAVARYRDALAAAAAPGDHAVEDADRAELYYGLGAALYRARDDDAAARALERAVALGPREGEFRFMLGLTHYDRGDDFAAARDFTAALKLGLDPAEAARARDLGRRLANAHRREGDRLYIEVRAGAGYDSDVPQSGVVVTTPTQKVRNDAAELTGVVDVAYRPVGDARNGLTLEYRFDQLAYLSSALDQYSLQEHDLTLAGAWSPHPRVTIDLTADGYAMFAGVLGYTPFQAGVNGGLRLVLRENAGFETQLRYNHVYKRSLDDDYGYLTGQREEAGATERWRGEHGRVSLGYQFTYENVGEERIPVDELALPKPIDQLAPLLLKPVPTEFAQWIYHVPYSYYGHEVVLAGMRDLPLGLVGALTLRYEHRDYLGVSRIVSTDESSSVYPRQRVDDRFTGEVSLRRPLGRWLEVAVDYTLVINRSTIDNSNAKTALDYDDKNFLKHVVELQLAFLY